MFAWLGDMKIGVAAWTGPTSRSDTFANDLVQHAVVSGKPVVQKMGPALDVQKLDFYCDETFCNPSAEWAKLKSSYWLSRPLPLVFGNGGFDALQYTVNSLSRQTKLTDSYGKIVQFSASLDLLEAPLMSGLSLSLPTPGVVAKAVFNPLTRR